MNKKFFKVFSGMTLLVLISKGLGFIRETLIAIRYGAGFVSDVYVLEDGLINALHTIWACVIGTTFVPSLLALDKNKRNRFINNYLHIFLIIIINVVIFSIIFTDSILHVLIPGFYETYSTEIIDKLVFITRINMCSLIFVFLENFFVILLQTNKIFIFSSIQGIILNLSLILYLCFFYQYEIWGIIFTKLAAHSINILILIKYIKNKTKFEYLPYVNLKSKYIRQVARLAIPVLIVNLISQMNYIVDRSVASLLNSGSMALLNYANVIASLIYSVIGLSLVSMAYVEFGLKQNEEKELKKTVSKSVVLLVNLLVPICLTMAFLRREIVFIFYGHGKINQDVVETIASLLLLYIPSNFALSLRDIYNRLLYIHKKTLITSLISGICFGLNIILNLLLVQVFHIYGLALATSITSILATIVTVIYCKKKKYIDFNLKIRRRNIVKIFLMSVIGFFLQKLLYDNNIMIKIGEIIFLIVMFIIIYNIEILVLEINERRGKL